MTKKKAEKLVPKKIVKSTPRVLRFAMTMGREEFVKWMMTRGWTREEALNVWNGGETRRERVAVRDDAIYRILRDYQDGKFNATNGVSAGMLGISLTTVYDKIREAANNV
jgi:hypothetical protein